MNIIKSEEKLCMCCMEEHVVHTVKLITTTCFKGQTVQYESLHEYCDHADDFDTPEDMVIANDIALKNAYRKAMGLLTSQEIAGIRKKYGISQTDLASLLEWGGKTITRYEGHQVQDNAHDLILRKLNDDPEWFLFLLNKNKSLFSDAAYQKYQATAEGLFATCGDTYLRKSLLAKYAKFNSKTNECGNVPLNIDKIIDVIKYFASSKNVLYLYKVKLMKLMWYADNLLFKRIDRSITGLAYCAQPMGAVAIGHKTIMEFDGVKYREIDFDDDRVGYKFLPIENYSPQYLSPEEIDALDTIVTICGSDTKDQIVERMHLERAFIETAEGDIIQYQYAKYLSID